VLKTKLQVWLPHRTYESCLLALLPSSSTARPGAAGHGACVVGWQFHRQHSARARGVKLQGHISCEAMLVAKGAACCAGYTCCPAHYQCTASSNSSYGPSLRLPAGVRTATGMRRAGRPSACSMRFLYIEAYYHAYVQCTLRHRHGWPGNTNLSQEAREPAPRSLVPGCPACAGHHLS
jgi:hypothetical protein